MSYVYSPLGVPHIVTLVLFFFLSIMAWVANTQLTGLTLSTQQNFLFFKISLFLVETIGGVCILLHTHEVRQTNLKC